MCSVRHSPMPCGAEPAGPLGVLRGVGVGAHPQPARLVGVRHEPVHGLDQLVGVVATSGSSSPSKYSHDRRGHHRHLAEEDLAGGAVDRDDVALLDHGAAGA